MGIRKLLSVAIFLATPILVNAQAPVFTQVIVFGDSLSDDGNIAHRARDLVGFSYPSSNFNYSDYRFTDDTNTSPAANLYVGTWHEQLEKTFLGLAVAKNSLDGGTDYAFGGATTKDGTQDRTIINNPFPFGDPTRVLALDYASAIYRDHLKSVIASTKSGLHGSGITIQVYPFDVWLDVIRVLGQPAHYNFVNTIDSAQGASGVNPDQY